MKKVYEKKLLNLETNMKDLAKKVEKIPKYLPLKESGFYVFQGYKFIPKSILKKSYKIYVNVTKPVFLVFSDKGQNYYMVKSSISDMVKAMLRLGIEKDSKVRLVKSMVNVRKKWVISLVQE